ncbi:MAG: hypothetical protein R2847_08920 [Bacteroidia bacterium]
MTLNLRKSPQASATATNVNCYGQSTGGCKYFSIQRCCSLFL